MKVCIVGGGHIGTTLAAYIKNRDSSKIVSVYTRRPEKFAAIIKCNDWEQNISYEVSLDLVSNNAELAVKDADIIYIALPHFAVEKAFIDIAPYVKDRACVGVLPGGGGCEFFFHKYFGDAVSLFGFQRVPFTAKLVEYGKETNLKSWKPYSVVGTLKRERLDEVCVKIEECGLKTKQADNYLCIALTPTNPILHTSRTYEIFHRFCREHEFAVHEKFYVGWTDDASRTLFSMDHELHELLDKIDMMDTSTIRPLTEHYEAPSIEAMTAKINGIKTFQSVYAPMKKSPKDNEMYIADTESRMFTEDFPWGLIIIRAYCEYFEVEAPTMDKLLMWYSDYMGLEWYVNGKLCGKDLINTGIPQNYGVRTKEELLQCYV